MHELVISAVAAQLNRLTLGSDGLDATARWARSLFYLPDEMITDLPVAHRLTESGAKMPEFEDWLTSVRRGFEITCDELRVC